MNPRIFNKKPTVFSISDKIIIITTKSGMIKVAYTIGVNIFLIISIDTF